MAYRWPEGDVLIVDVDEQGEWVGGTHAEFVEWGDAVLEWKIQPRSKERPLPQAFAHRAVAGSKLISHLCRPR
jgi:hypothetical protein